MSFSPLITQLIDALRCLPGVGPKTAQRMVFHLLERDRKRAIILAKTIEKAMAEVKNCARCRTFSESEFCRICSSANRDESQLCVVESPADVLALEQTAGFKGFYFVLMGHLSPLDGIGPNELGIDDFIKIIATTPVKEVIIATNPTVEGEATSHYLATVVKEHGLKVSRIARGVPMGGELEYLDGGTLARALASRVVV